MSQLSLNDDKLVLTDLFDNAERQKAVKLTKMWLLYEDPLREVRDEILALPPSVVDMGRPLAEQLASADTLHDAWGLFLFLLEQAYRSYPGLEPEFVAVLDQIHEHVIAERKELQEAYSKEASRAVDRVPKLPQLKTAFKLIPLAGAQTKTLFDAVQKFTDAGVELHSLLSERGTKEAGIKSRAATLGLRAKAHSLINEARATLANEIAHSKGKLSKDLDGKIFGYADALLKAQAERDAAGAAKAAAAKAAAHTAPAAEGTPPVKP